MVKALSKTLFSYPRNLPVPMMTLVLVFCAALSIFFYGFFLNKTISLAVEREDGLREIEEVEASIAELDGAYVLLKQSLTIEKAHELGFVEVERPLFLSLTKDTPPLGLLRP